MITKNDLIKGQEVYYCQIMPKLQKYNILNLVVRTIEFDYFVGLEKVDKTAFLFAYKDTENVVFLNRGEALEYIKNEELKDD